MVRVKIKNTGVEFDIIGIGTENARLIYSECEDCRIPVYYIQNFTLTIGDYQGNNYISKDELDYWLSNGEAEIVEFGSNENDETETAKHKYDGSVLEC